jgi:hypothetical protein
MTGMLAGEIKNITGKTIVPGNKPSKAVGLIDLLK